MTVVVVAIKKKIRWPKRYRNEFGQLKEGAPYSEREIRRPLELQMHDAIGYFTILVILFFFKQKTAYEMLSGDWSSDVCSSDLSSCASSATATPTPSAYCSPPT